LLCAPPHLHRVSRESERGMAGTVVDKIMCTERARALTFGLAVMAALLFGLLLVARPAHAATTFTVNSTGDGADANTADNICDSDASTEGEQCTLRAAIQQANATSGADEIHFSIAGTGVHTIAPSSILPPITEAVTIDGYTQDSDTSDTSDDAKPNTLAVGNNAVLKIELDGDGEDHAPGLRIWVANSTVKGLIINRFESTGVSIDEGLNKIEGNYIGTDPTGTLARGNSSGVSIQGNSNTVGGTSPQARNIISGNAVGVFIAFGGVTGNRVMGNYIGTDKDGDDDLGNSFDGVHLAAGVSNNTIGGTEAGARNIISGNGRFGVTLSGGATGNRVMSNYIGTDAAGTVDLGNTDDGVRIEGGASGNSIEAGNIISGNGGDGVEVSYWQNSNMPEENDPTPATGNSILSNSIYDNDALGIDLSIPPNVPPGVTANDGKDRDTGPNNLQNYPVLTTVTTSSGQTTIEGKLTSRPRKRFTIQFFSNASADSPSGFGEGREFVGEMNVKTNRRGKRPFTFTVNQDLSGQFITATATRLVPDPNDPATLLPTDTSELSQAVQVN
jgi:CSLREA domain-containing protein